MDTPAPGAVTRPADAAEDPYVWQPVGAFGPASVTAKPPAPQPEPKAAAAQPAPLDSDAAARKWRWPDFLIGLTFGAGTVAILSLIFNFDRR